MSPTKSTKITAEGKRHHPDIESVYSRWDRILARRYVEQQQLRRALIARPVPRIYIPRMDICDDEELPRVFAALEIPGIRKQDLTLRIENDMLLVEGVRATPLHFIVAKYAPPLTQSQVQHPNALGLQCEGSERQTATASGEHNPDTNDNTGVGLGTAAAVFAPRYATRELAFGKFKRAIALPKGTTTDQISADLVEGMLYISWPRKVSVETGSDVRIPVPVSTPAQSPLSLSRTTTATVATKA